MNSHVCRHTDAMTGVVAEVGIDGVPVGLALPDELLTRPPGEVARAVLRSLTGAAAGARELLEELAEQEWDARDRGDAPFDDDALAEAAR